MNTIFSLLNQSAIEIANQKKLKKIELDKGPIRFVVKYREGVQIKIFEFGSVDITKANLDIISRENFSELIQLSESNSQDGKKLLGELKLLEKAGRKIMFISDLQKVASVIGVIMGITLGYWSLKFYHEFRESKNFKMQLISSVNVVNKKCPVKLDEFLTLTRVSMGDNLEVIYSYDLMGFSKEEIPGQEKQIREGMRDLVWKTGVTRKQIQDGIKITYIYSDGAGKVLFKFSLSESDYNGN